MMRFWFIDSYTYELIKKGHAGLLVVGPHWLIMVATMTNDDQ